MADSIFASAKIVSNSDNIKKFELNSFSKKSKSLDEKDLDSNLNEKEDLEKDLKVELVKEVPAIIDNSEV